MNKDWNRICKDGLSYVSYVSLGYSCGGLKMWLLFIEPTSIWVSLTFTCYCRILAPGIPGNTQSPMVPQKNLMTDKFPLPRNLPQPQTPVGLGDAHTQKHLPSPEVLHQAY